MFKNKIFKKKKSIPLDTFMKIALYDKNFGYYNKKNPFGLKGDYITSPTISNLFTEMMTVWCVSFWNYLNKPNRFYLCELGPGDGSMCKNFLNTSKYFGAFHKSLRIRLLENSKILKKIQKEKIKSNKVKWINRIEDIKSGPVIFFGNEFFDALPIKQIYHKDKKIFQKFVTVNEKNKKINFIYKKISKNLSKKLAKYKISNYNGSMEYPVETIKYLVKIAKKIRKYNGGILLIDYGYTKKKVGNTLQAIKKHSYTNILNDISDVDISSQVDFNLIANILRKNKLNISKVVNQGSFLQKLGILERAEIVASKYTFKDKANLYYRIKRLLDEKEMGKVYKVLFAQKKNSKFSVGF